MRQVGLVRSAAERNVEKPAGPRYIRSNSKDHSQAKYRAMLGANKGYLHDATELT